MCYFLLNFKYLFHRVDDLYLITIDISIKLEKKERGNILLIEDMQKEMCRAHFIIYIRFQNFIYKLII